MTRIIAWSFGMSMTGCAYAEPPYEHGGPYYGRGAYAVPEGHMPPPGECRVSGMMISRRANNRRQPIVVRRNTMPIVLAGV